MDTSGRFSIVGDNHSPASSAPLPSTCFDLCLLALPRGSISWCTTILKAAYKGINNDLVDTARVYCFAYPRSKELREPWEHVERYISVVTIVTVYRQWKSYNVCPIYSGSCKKKINKIMHHITINYFFSA